MSGFLFRDIGNVEAQVLPSCSVTAEGIEPVSGFNLVTIVCSLKVLKDPLQIQILDRGNEFGSTGLSVGSPVPVLDPHNQVWIFDYVADDSPELVIDFHPQDTALVADLYDRQGADPNLAYQFNLTGLVFQRPHTPTVEVTAPDGWWFNGKINNFNLDITIDGRVTAEFDLGRMFDYFAVAKDGKTDYDIHVRDNDGDGRPDDDWRTAHIKPFTGLRLLAAVNTNLTVNVAHNETLLQPTLPWAYLNEITYGYLTSSSATTGQPPIQVDWTKGTIEYLGEFVSSRGNDNQWFVYSFNALEPGVVNQPNFEAPFAWYDLADDHDGQPELAIRFVEFPAFDKYFLEGRYDKPITNVRYSWSQNNDGNWNYKLGLLSSLRPDSTVEVPSLNLKLAIPDYNDLPGWVTGQSWDIATFVSSEDQKVSGEGIYEWDIPAPVVNNYFTGYLDFPVPRKPDGSFDLSALKFSPSGPGIVIDPGLRGEYAFTLNRQPMVYISAVDGKLHLSHAEGSYWDTGSDQGVVRGSDMDGDGYQDRWQYFQNNVPVEELVHTSYALIHDDTDTVTIQLTSIPSHYVESTPPATHAAWLDLGNELNQYKDLHLIPGQFSNRITQAVGPTLTLQNATASDFRPTKDHMRFVMELGSDFTESGEIPNISGLLPGKQLVQVSAADGVKITPLKPADIVIVSNHIEAATPPEALSPVHISIDLKNDGDEDIYNARVVWSFIDENGKAVPFVGTVVNLLGGEVTHVQTNWTPASGGNWQILAQVTPPEGSQNTAQELTLETTFDVKTPVVDQSETLNLGGELPVGGLLIVIFAICLVVVAPIIFVLVFRNER